MARSEAAQLDLRGGHPAVDLVNTVAWRGEPQRRKEYLVDYRDLVAWGRHAGVLSPHEARTLTQRAASDSEVAAKTLSQTRRLREALHRVWTGCGTARDAGRVADAYRAAMRASCLSIDEGVGRWHDPTLVTQTPLNRLAVEAVALLTAVPFSRVKGCGDAACGWLFVDASHRQNRRWCSTADCGNRSRVRSFYQRARDGRGDQSG
jgi:predicted RNA-binding Zn ribbon-like protein